jgi:protein TonB
LCGVGFNAPRKALKAGSATDAPPSAAGRLAAAEAAQDGALEQRQAFELQGNPGIDYVAPSAGGPDRGDLLQYTALVDTPTLRVAMVCTTARDDMAAALPAFRRIRDGIRLAGPNPTPRTR